MSPEGGIKQPVESGPQSLADVLVRIKEAGKFSKKDRGNLLNRLYRCYLALRELEEGGAKPQAFHSTLQHWREEIGELLPEKNREVLLDQLKPFYERRLISDEDLLREYEIPPLRSFGEGKSPVEVTKPQTPPLASVETVPQNAHTGRMAKPEQQPEPQEAAVRLRKTPSAPSSQPRQPERPPTVMPVRGEYLPAEAVTLPQDIQDQLRVIIARGKEEEARVLAKVQGVDDPEIRRAAFFKVHERFGRQIHGILAGHLSASGQAIPKDWKIPGGFIQMLPGERYINGGVEVPYQPGTGVSDAFDQVVVRTNQPGASAPQERWFGGRNAEQPFNPETAVSNPLFFEFVKRRNPEALKNDELLEVQYNAYLEQRKAVRSIVEFYLSFAQRDGVVEINDAMREQAASAVNAFIESRIETDPRLAARTLELMKEYQEVPARIAAKEESLEKLASPKHKERLARLKEHRERRGKIEETAASGHYARQMERGLARGWRQRFSRELLGREVAQKGEGELDLERIDHEFSTSLPPNVTEPQVEQALERFRDLPIQNGEQPYFVQRTFQQAEDDLHYEFEALESSERGKNDKEYVRARKLVLINRFEHIFAHSLRGRIDERNEGRSVFGKMKDAIGGRIDAWKERRAARKVQKSPEYKEMEELLASDTLKNIEGNIERVEDAEAAKKMLEGMFEGVRSELFEGIGVAGVVYAGVRDAVTRRVSELVDGLAKDWKKASDIYAYLQKLEEKSSGEVSYGGQINIEATRANVSAIAVGMYERELTEALGRDMPQESMYVTLKQVLAPFVSLNQLGSKHSGEVLDLFEAAVKRYSESPNGLANPDKVLYLGRLVALAREGGWSVERKSEKVAEASTHKKHEKSKKGHGEAKHKEGESIKTFKIGQAINIKVGEKFQALWKIKQFTWKRDERPSDDSIVIVERSKATGKRGKAALEMETKRIRYADMIAWNTLGEGERVREDEEEGGEGADAEAVPEVAIPVAQPLTADDLRRLQPEEAPAPVEEEASAPAFSRAEEEVVRSAARAPREMIDNDAMRGSLKDPKRYYTHEEAMRMLDITGERLDRLVEEGDIRGFRVNKPEGFAVEFKRTEIESLAGRAGKHFKSESEQ